MLRFVPENLSQAINPWSWWLNATGNSASLINISNYKSGNPDLEQKIVRDIAGYGMQLGAIEDVLEILISFLPNNTLDLNQQKKIEKFLEMISRIKAEKRRSLEAQLSPVGLDKLIDEIQTLKLTNPEQYREIIEKLKKVL